MGNTIRFLNESETNAVIEIYGTIGGYDYETWKQKNTFESMQKELNRLKELNTQNIEVRICSYGGYVDHALAIHDALADHPAKITTVVNSYCASAATIIAMAGDVRKISKNALFLIHKCSSYVWGNESDLSAELESQKTTNSVIYNIYKDKCKKTDAELKELFDYNSGQGKWITAQEVLVFGFATEIYNEQQSAKAASLDYRMMNILNLPPLPEQQTNNADTIADTVFARIKEFFNPKNSNPINNQKQQTMSVFNEKFVALAALFVITADYDPAKGHTFTDDELKVLNDKMNELSQFTDKLAKAEDKITAKDAEIATITASRDDYKAKYEKGTKTSTSVNASDPTHSFEDSIENDDYYKSIQNQLKQF